MARTGWIPLALPSILVLSLSLTTLPHCQAGHGRLNLRRVQTHNPLLEKYRRWALAYERDAWEAEQAAKKYASMARAVGSGGAATQQAVNQEMRRLKVKPWANAVWQFEAMVRDPRPAKAAIAEGEARKPYEEQFHAYARRQQDFDAAAHALAERVNSDTDLAKSLATYSNQYTLEGNAKRSAEFQQQAKTLMQQAKSEKALAEQYHEMAEKLHGALPKINDMASMAGAYAGYGQNPAGALQASQLVPFTVAPPPAEGL